MFLDIDWSLFVIISSISSVLLMMIIAFTVIFLGKRKVKKGPKIDENFINNIIVLYGNKDNISKVSTDNGRLKIEVKDLDKVELEKLKEISTNGVFVTGSTIKTLFRHDSELIKKELEKRL